VKTTNQSCDKKGMCSTTRKNESRKEGDVVNLEPKWGGEGSFPPFGVSCRPLESYNDWGRCKVVSGEGGGGAMVTGP